jgi:hypothetical protein
MREQWQSGLEDTRRTLKRRDWMALPEQGMSIGIIDPAKTEAEASKRGRIEKPALSLRGLFDYFAAAGSATRVEADAHRDGLDCFRKVARTTRTVQRTA